MWVKSSLHGHPYDATPLSAMADAGTIMNTWAHSPQ